METIKPDTTAVSSGDDCTSRGATEQKFMGTSSTCAGAGEVSIRGWGQNLRRVTPVTGRVERIRIESDGTIVVDLDGGTDTRLAARPQRAQLAIARDVAVLVVELMRRTGGSNVGVVKVEKLAYERRGRGFAAIEAEPVEREVYDPAGKVFVRSGGAKQKGGAR